MGRGSPARDQSIGVPPNTTTTNPIVTTFPLNGTNYTRHAALSWTLALTGIRNLPHNICTTPMTDKSKQPAKRDSVILSLEIAIGSVNIGKEVSSMTPAPAVFGVATILLTTIRVSFLPSMNETFQDQSWPG